MIVIKIRKGVVFSIDVPYHLSLPGQPGWYEHDKAVETCIGNVTAVDEPGPWTEYTGPWRFNATAPLTQEDLIKVFHKLEGLNMHARMYGVKPLPDEW